MKIRKTSPGPARIGQWTSYQGTLVKAIRRFNQGKVWENFAPKIDTLNLLRTPVSFHNNGHRLVTSSKNPILDDHLGQGAAVFLRNIPFMTLTLE